MNISEKIFELLDSIDKNYKNLTDDEKIKWSTPRTAYKRTANTSPLLAAALSCWFFLLPPGVIKIQAKIFFQA